MKKIFSFLYLFSTITLYSQIDSVRFYPNGDLWYYINVTKSNIKHLEEDAVKLIKSRGVSKIQFISVTGDFKHLPDFIYSFTDVLYVEINSIRCLKLDTELSKLSKLNQLRINSKVIYISDEVKMNNLKSLSIEFYHSKEFPKSICNWTELEDLNLQQGKFTMIPDEIYKLKKLKILNLSGNNIQSIPEEINLLASLEVLSLCGNHIAQIPENVCKLENLRELYLTDNKIEVSENIKICLSQLSNFKSLYL